MRSLSDTSPRAASRRFPWEQSRASRRHLSGLASAPSSPTWSGSCAATWAGELACRQHLHLHAAPGQGHRLQRPDRSLVRIHPETARPSLRIGRHAYCIPGLTAESSERLLDELLELACHPPRIHRHRWRPGDVALWDNRYLLHRGLPWNMEEPRVMPYSRIAGDPRSEAGIPPETSAAAGTT